MDPSTIPVIDRPSDQFSPSTLPLQNTAQPVQFDVSQDPMRQLAQTTQSLNEFLNGTGNLAQAETQKFDISEKEKALQASMADPTGSFQFTGQESKSFQDERMRLWGKATGSQMAIDLQSKLADIATDPEKLKNTNIPQFIADYYQQHAQGVTDPHAAPGIYDALQKTIDTVQPALVHAQKAALYQDNQNLKGQGMFNSLAAGTSSITDLAKDAQSPEDRKLLWNAVKQFGNYISDANPALSSKLFATPDPTKPDDEPTSPLMQKDPRSGLTWLQIATKDDPQAGAALSQLFVTQRHRDLEEENRYRTQVKDWAGQSAAYTLDQYQKTGSIDTDALDQITKADPTTGIALRTALNQEITSRAQVTATNSFLNSGGHVSMLEEPLQKAANKQYADQVNSALYPQDTSPEGRQQALTQVQSLIQRGVTQGYDLKPFKEYFDNLPLLVPDDKNATLDPRLVQGYTLWKNMKDSAYFKEVNSKLFSEDSQNFLSVVDSLVGPQPIGGNQQAVMANLPTALVQAKALYSPEAKKGAQDWMEANGKTTWKKVTDAIDLPGLSMGSDLTDQALSQNGAFYQEGQQLLKTFAALPNITPEKAANLVAQQLQRRFVFAPELSSDGVNSKWKSYIGFNKNEAFYAWQPNAEEQKDPRVAATTPTQAAQYIQQYTKLMTIHSQALSGSDKIYSALPIIGNPSAVVIEDQYGAPAPEGGTIGQGGVMRVSQAIIGAKKNADLQSVTDDMNRMKDLESSKLMSPSAFASGEADREINALKLKIGQRVDLSAEVTKIAADQKKFVQQSDNPTINSLPAPPAAPQLLDIPPMEKPPEIPPPPPGFNFVPKGAKPGLKAVASGFKASEKGQLGQIPPPLPR